HVGGVARSRDGGLTWTPTVDVEADVHQVLAHPKRPDVVLAAAYEGFGISRDGGDTWEFLTDGMHNHYASALAVADDPGAGSARRAGRTACWAGSISTCAPVKRSRSSAPTAPARPPCCAWRPRWCGRPAAPSVSPAPIARASPRRRAVSSASSATARGSTR